MKGYQIEPDITRASTLPAEYYFDEKAFKQGKESYFARSWQWVADSDIAKVPGQVTPLTLLPDLLGEPILFTRDSNDQLHCLSNVCTHRGMILCEGACNERFLRCRYHGRRFGLDGQFQSMPEFDKAIDFPREEDHLTKVPFAKWGNQLFVSLNPRMPFEEMFAPMLERLSFLPLDQFVHDPSQSREYLVKCHWTLYCDNYLEGFHIPFIHAELNAVIDYENYETHLYDWCNLQLAESKGAEDCFDLPAGHPDFGRNIAAYYYWLFPNMMFNFYPWGLSINVVRPISPSTTKVSFIRYVWKPELVGSGAGAALDRVEREDEAVVELVQKGLASRHYTTGRFSPTRETGTHHFHRLLAENL